MKDIKNNSSACFKDGDVGEDPHTHEKVNFLVHPVPHQRHPGVGWFFLSSFALVCNIFSADV